MSGELVKGLDAIASKYVFKDGLKLKRLENEGQFDAAVNDGVYWDARVRKVECKGIAPVFAGLAYDKENIRAQSYFLESDEGVVATATFLVTPKKYALSKRYFKKDIKGVSLDNIEGIVGAKAPQYFISPAWTRVHDSYRGIFAAKGFSFFKDALDFIGRDAGSNAWIKMSAQGIASKGERREISKMSGKVGDYFSKRILPFDLDILGKNTEGSNSTVKIARLLGFESFEGVGELSHLGPVMIRKGNT